MAATGALLPHKSIPLKKADDRRCSSPVAAFAEVDGDEIFIRGLYYSEATGKWLTGQIRGAAEDGEKLGIALAKQLKSDCEGR